MSYFIGSDAVGFSQPLQDMDDEGRFVALSAMGHWCHIWGIGLKNETVERHYSRQDLWQMALLERRDTADTKNEVVELQQFGSFFFIACETVEHAAGQLMRVPL